MRGVLAGEAETVDARHPESDLLPQLFTAEAWFCRSVDPVPGGEERIVIEPDRRWVTLKEWAAEVGYSHGYVVHVMPRRYPDFPAPERPRRGMSDQGGGGGSAWYDPVKLEPFRPRRAAPLELDEEDLDREVTLGGFARLIGVDGRSVSQIKDDRPDTLPNTVDGQRWYPRARFYVRDLLLMWNSRPGQGSGSDKRRPPLPWSVGEQ